MNSHDYNSVIFDMDGVLINSTEDEDWKYSAVEKALNELNVTEQDKRIYDALLGDLGYKKCLSVCQEFDIDARIAWTLVAKYTTKHRAKEIKNNHINLFKDFKDLKSHLSSINVKTAIISNAPMAAVDLTIESFDLKQFFDFYLGVRNFDDLQVRKPHPNHLEIARAELKREPCIYIGDAESDIIAAQRAGMDSVWIKRNSFDSDVSADYEIKDLNKLRNIVF